MKTKQFSATAHTFRALQALAVTFQTGTRDDIAAHLLTAHRDPVFAGPQAQAMLSKLLALATEYSASPYSIFAMSGNAKLPFVAFSTLPGVTCPGAGACLEFCYSFNAWRYPHAFGRQAQNAFLMRFRPDVIRAEFARVAARPKLRAGFDFRLYVDGDFSSAGDVAFWMLLLAEHPHARGYGYSKSFAELLAHHDAGRAWPSNYRLNESSGHAHDTETVQRVRALPIYRGRFVAVNIGRKVTSADHGTREVNDTLRTLFRASDGVTPFPCPGKCGSCTNAGHACGSSRFTSIPIVIAVH